MNAGGCYMGLVTGLSVGGLLAGKGSKHACTFSKTDALPPSSLILQPVSAANRLSSLSKRCEVEVGELPLLAASE